MNNLLSYCVLVDAKIKASDKDLPVPIEKMLKLAIWHIFLEDGAKLKIFLRIIHLYLTTNIFLFFSFLVES